MPMAPEIPFRADLATVDRVKNMGGWSWYQAVGYRELRIVEILIPAFLPSYLLVIISVIVLILAVLGKYKGTARGLSAY
jgi:hypothetical protein